MSNAATEPGSEAWLKERNIVWDPTGMGRPRYTHTPTGRACIQYDYLTWPADWRAALVEFGQKAERGELA